MPPFYINLEQTFDTLLHNTNIIYYQVLRFSKWLEVISQDR